MRLRDRVCLVTGAGSGIGRRAAILMAAEGARVAVLSRTAEEIDATAEEIRSAGGEALAVRADVSKADEMRRAVDDTVRAFGALHVVFANAGVNGVWAPIEDLGVEEWSETLAINLTGTFLTLKFAVPHLKKNGGAIIVNSSVNGTRVFSNSGATAYSATKAAQVAMVKMLALELARDRIRVNAICPGAIDTEIQDNTERRDTDDLGVQVEVEVGRHPLAGRPGTADEVARVVLFLASDDADHVTGTVTFVDGGESLIGPRG